MTREHLQRHYDKTIRAIVTSHDKREMLTAADAAAVAHHYTRIDDPGYRASLAVQARRRS